MVHYNVAPINALMDSSVLYDLERNHRIPINVEIVGVSSYAGSVPTFNVIVEKKSIFSYVPPTMFYSKNFDLDEDGKIEEELVPWELNDLCYTECPGNVCAVSQWDWLLGKQLNCFFPRRMQWVRGDYWFTMDWPEANELMHAVKLVSGRIAFVPNHKIQIESGEPNYGLPDFKKLHTLWALNRK